MSDRFMIFRWPLALMTFAVVILIAPYWAIASEDTPEPPAVSVPTDDDSIETGKRIVLARCKQCHSLQYLRDPDSNEPYLTGLTEDAAVSRFGIVPPDLSLIAIARPGRADYTYAFLTGYEADSADCSTPGGTNRYFPGGCTSMADPELTDEQALAVTAFLKEAADPHEKRRTSIGLVVEIFLGVLTILSFIVYRRVKKRELG